MKQPTNIKIKGKGGKQIGVMIDADEPTSAPSRKVNEDGTISRNAAALIEDGILAKVNQIVADAICTADVVRIDPNDPWGEGKVIAKAGAVSTKEFAAALAGANDAWLRIGEDLILPPTADKMTFMRKANADLMTARLRTEMTNVAAELEDGMAPEDAKPLAAWTSDVRIENFAEWLLDRGGWSKATAKRIELCDELKRCFAGVPASVGEAVEHDAIKGNELTKWPIKWRAIRMAGKHSAPVEQAQRGLLADEAPADYLDGLEMAFRRGFWDVLLKTADKDERDKKGKAVPVEDSFAWLRMMVRPYVEEQAAHIVQTRISSISIVVRARAKTEAGDEYTAFPRVLGSSMPMIGGHFTIEYNGEKYAQEPTLAEKAIHGTLRTLQKQQSVDVVVTAWAKKETEQYTLALDIEIAKPYLRDAHGAPLKLTAGPMEVVVGTATAARLPALTIKAIPYMIAACGLTDKKVIDSLEKVGRDLYPAYATGKGGQIKPWETRQQVDKDLHNIVQAITIAGRGLQVRVTEESGSYRYYDLFSINAPSIIKPDELIGWRINPWLLEKMLGGTAGGHFLLNMTRWLPIGLTDPGLFSVIFGIAKTLDAHRIHGIYAPERQRPISWDQFADQCNVLPMISERRDEKSIKASKREARNKLEARLDTAQELGHLGDWRKTMRKLPGGKGFEFSIVAPPDYPEACKMAVKAWKGQSRRQGGQRGKTGKG